MAKTLLKTVEGIDIFIDDESGSFSAKIAGREVKKRSLRDIEKEIEKTKGALPAYELTYGHKFNKVEILGFEKGRARIKEDGRLGRYSERYYIIDEVSLDKLEKLRNRLEEIEELWRQELESLPQVRERDFEELRKKYSPQDPES